MLKWKLFFGIELHKGQARKQANDTLESCLVHVSAKTFLLWKNCLGLQQLDDGSKTRIDMQLTPRATRLFTLAFKKIPETLTHFLPWFIFSCITCYMFWLLHVLFVYMFMCFVAWCFDWNFCLHVVNFCVF